MTSRPTRAASTVASGEEREGGDVARLAPATSSTPIAIADDHRPGTEVGLDDDRDAGHAHDDQPAEESGVADLVGALLGEIGGERDEHGELGELGGLEADRADVEGDLVVAGHQADSEEEHERRQRGDVHLARAVPEPVVVDDITTTSTTAATIAKIT